MSVDKVFAQAEALWKPKREELRREWKRQSEQIDRAWAAGGGYRSGNRLAEQAQLAERELKGRNEALLSSILDAHKLVGNRKGPEVSQAAFEEWCTDRIEKEAAPLLAIFTNPLFPQNARDECIAMVNKAQAIERDRLHAALVQHFAVDSENWLLYWGKKLIGLPFAAIRKLFTSV